MLGLMSETVIKVENLTKFYQLGLINHGTLAKDLQGWWAKLRGKDDPNSRISMVSNKNNNADTDFIYALKDVSFDVQQGEVLGIIGANGAGKSTLLKILSRVTSPTSGCIKIKGRIGSLLEVGTGFHPELTGRENIYLNGAILGMRRHEIDKKLDEIIDFSGVEKFIDTPVKRYSSGMYVRLAFAVAAHLDPEILVVDEVLAVGDADFQKKCLGKMGDVSKKEGRTVLFVSHNMTAVKQLCKNGVLLENGKISYIGTAENAITKYLGISGRDVTALPERKDRIGNGKIRLTNVLFRDKDNNIITKTFVGQYLKIEFNIEINGNVDLSKLIVGCIFFDPYENQVVQWTSDEMFQDFSKMSDGTFYLEIPELNLRPNTYYMYVQLSIGSTARKDFCDAIYSAAQLVVMNSDFFVKDINLHPNRGHTALLKGKYLL